MAEKIEVGYTYVPGIGGFGIYHKYILYTNSAGEQFYARGGPDVSASPEFGTIDTEFGEYNKDTKDWDPARDPANPDPTAIPHPRETRLYAVLCGN